MPEVIELEFHSKELSGFQLSRLVWASLRKYTVSITAFISDALITEETCLGGLSITLRRTMPTTEPMVLSSAPVKFNQREKKAGFGCSRLKMAITSSLGQARPRKS